MKTVLALATATLMTVTLASAAAAQSFDHSAFDSVLARYVRDGRVDYAALKANRSGLDRYLGQMAAVTADQFESWPERDRIAYLINAYNAYALETVIDRYPIDGGGLIKKLLYPENSIRQIGGVFDEIEHRAAGADLTLDDIEHGRLREHYDEPRIHFALVCAAVSCPPLREEAYTGDELDEQLDDQGFRFLNDPRHNRFEVDRERVYLSKIFDWYGEDFRQFAPEDGYRGDEDVRGVLAFVSRYLVDRLATFLERGAYRVEFLDYDWTLNDQAVAASSR